MCHFTRKLPVLFCLILISFSAWKCRCFVEEANGTIFKNTTTQIMNFPALEEEGSIALQNHQQQRVKRGGGDGSSSSNKDGKKKRKGAETKTSETEKRQKHISIEQARRKDFKEIFETIANEIPREVFEIVTESNEVKISKNVRLRATCVYINWLRSILNKWNDLQTEAMQKLELFKEQIKNNRQLLLNAGKPTTFFNFPNLIPSPIADQYAEETVIDVNAMARTLFTKKLAEIDRTNKHLSERARIELERRILENAYVQLLQEMLHIASKTTTKYEILEAAKQEILRLKTLKSLVDEDKKQFASVFQQYDTYIDELITIGASVGMKFPPKPVIHFNLGVDENVEPADYFALSVDTGRSIAKEKASSEVEKRQKQCLAVLKRQNNFQSLLLSIAHQIPRELFNIVRERKELSSSKNFRLRATCVYINWLRATLNEWKNHQTEAKQLIALFREQIQDNHLLLLLVENSKASATLPDFNFPNLIPSPPELTQYTKEIIYDINAAAKSLYISRLAKVNHAKLAKLSELKRIELKSRTLEKAYVLLLHEMLHITKFVSKNKILEEANWEITRLRMLKSFVDEEKKQFAEVFQQYDTYMDILIKLGVSIGLHFPPKPVNNLKGVLNEAMEPADYLKLPTDALNPFVHLEQQHHDHDHHHHQVHQLTELQNADTEDVNNSDRHQQILSIIGEHLLNDSDDDDGDNAEEGVDDDDFDIPHDWLEDWESTLLSYHQNPPPHGGSSSSSPAQTVAFAHPQQHKTTAASQHTTFDDDNSRNEKEEEVEKTSDSTASATAEHQMTGSPRHWQQQH